MYDVLLPFQDLYFLKQKLHLRSKKIEQIKKRTNFIALKLNRFKTF